jgi:hypothetical protein
MLSASVLGSDAALTAGEASAIYVRSCEAFMVGELSCVVWYGIVWCGVRVGLRRWCKCTANWRDTRGCSETKSLCQARSEQTQ